jgi:Post-segregation antitoxin CcdA
MMGVSVRSIPKSKAKRPFNLSLNEALVQESRGYCGNLSAKVEGQGDKLTAARVQVSTNGVKPTQ